MGTNRATAVILLCLQSLLSGGSSALPSNDAVAHTSLGDLHGNRLADVNEFLGIPFAESPEGARRFRSPVDSTEQYGPKGHSARDFGARCLQPKVDSRNISYSEDCLFLNVWSPKGRPDNSEQLPVLVYIYGGGFLYCAGDMFNGTDLAAATSSVVVTFNYRLGVFGFADFGVNPDGANLGLLDQQSALRFVQREAQAFGGDPRRVLLFGESAGGMSAGFHIVLPSSAGLFRRVLVESGPPQALSAACAQRTGEEFSARAGCGEKATRMECLQRQSAESLMTIQTAMLMPTGNETDLDVPWSFFPSVDRKILAADPYQLLREGRTVPGPLEVAAGVNHDEYSMEAFEEWHRRMRLHSFEEVVARLLQAHGAQYPEGAVPELAQVYMPRNGTNDLRPELGDLLSDLIFHCRTREFLRLLTASGHRTFKYVFSHRAKADPAPKDWHVYHSSELPFIFGVSETGSMEILPRLDGPERRLQAQMRQLWASLAATGSPRTAEGQDWPPYSASLDNHLVLDTLANGTLQTSTGFRHLYCSVWDELWKNMPGDKAYRSDSKEILV